MATLDDDGAMAVFAAPLLFVRMAVVAVVFFGSEVQVVVARVAAVVVVFAVVVTFVVIGTPGEVISRSICQVAAPPRGPDGSRGLPPSKGVKGHQKKHDHNDDQ